jgi:hypothetical protein
VVDLPIPPFPYTAICLITRLLIDRIRLSQVGYFNYSHKMFKNATTNLAENANQIYKSN